MSKILKESLRSGDLKNLVDNIFTVDQFKSKMGEDCDVVVLGFKLNEKNPAIDLMEFIEKGYKFILDADMSSGEEHDGKYQVFVEIERTKLLPTQLNELLKGIGQLCSNKEWKFRYQKSPHSVEFNEQTVMEEIPTTASEYESKILEIKTIDLREFFDKGAMSLTLESNNTLTFSRPFAGNVKAKFIAIGDFENVKNIVPGKLSLDENSQSEVLFLTKYLGNYDIDKIGNKFLIRNGHKAIVIEKDKW